MTNEKHSGSEGASFLDQLPGGYHPIAADLSAFGMGSWEAYKRWLVLPLQSDFQEEVHRDDGGGDIPTKSFKPIILNTLHDQLLYYVLELADSIRFGLDKFVRLTNTVRNLYR